MVLIVEVCDSFSQRSNTSGRAVLSTGDGDVDGLGALEAAGNIVLDLGSSLAQIRPGIRVLEEAVLGSTLSAPDDAGGRSTGIETSVGHVALVCVAKLTVHLGLEFCRCRKDWRSAQQEAMRCGDAV